jgi:putative transcriptional regulator
MLRIVAFVDKIVGYEQVVGSVLANLATMKLFPENTLALRAGRLLVADPFLSDDYFGRAVILLVEHSDKGSLGFVLNKPIELHLHEVIDGFPEYEEAVHFGGPVQRDQLYYIHTIGEQLDGSMPIGNGLWWLGDFDQVREQLLAGRIGPKQIRFFIGYSGWETGQLPRELEEKSWYVARATPELIFESDATQHWGKVMRSIGSSHALMAGFPEDPSLN